MPPHMASPTPQRLKNKHFVKEGLVSVRIESAKQLHAGAYYKLMHKLLNIFPMKIIGLSCNFFKCPAKMSRLSCIDFYSGWQVYMENYNYCSRFLLSIYMCVYNIIHAH